MNGEGLLAGEGLEREEDPKAAVAPSVQDDDGDFKITIRKLDLPVRPRGVLAE